MVAGVNLVLSHCLGKSNQKLEFWVRVSLFWHLAKVENHNHAATFLTSMKKSRMHQDSFIKYFANNKTSLINVSTVCLSPTFIRGIKRDLKKGNWVGDFSKNTMSRLDCNRLSARFVGLGTSGDNPSLQKRPKPSLFNPYLIPADSVVARSKSYNSRSMG